MLPYNKGLKTNARALRSQTTDAEQKLWYRLRRKQINGWQFYRQKPIGPYIVDFYCAAANLVVEIDGKIHFYHKQHDAARSEVIKSLGVSVVRFRNEEIENDMASVLETLKRMLKS